MAKAKKKSPAKRGRKKRKLEDLPSQPDPTTELDSALLLNIAAPILKQLNKDLLDRATSSPAVTRALKARHAAERAAERTADNFNQWQDHFVSQVAAAWFLSCIFVRTLEDRGLLANARIAGPGAADSQKIFLSLAPHLTERDYLLTTFRELAHFPAARPLFAPDTNPVWLLAPSAEACQSLLTLLRSPDADAKAPAFRFGQPDTRFLGDLYQDLDEGVRKRFALLQTPRFVESFILDRTLERAIDRFGLDETTLIDPTCGSGHFLLGAFDRLYDHRLRATPGLDPRQAATQALDAVYGADINPYAVAIARFRLTLAFLEKANYTRLSEAPTPPLHLVVADSLLHNPHLTQLHLGDLPDQTTAQWKGEEFALENETAAREVLHRTYTAVVGNPPYITVKDKVLRDRYRALYATAAGKYSVAVPFTERFFQLGREGAYIGMITANSFMKREFGKKLIQDYLPTVNLDFIINTSGAYIPGHGTPTVLLFGSSEAPQDTTIKTVLANRGEPSTPANPVQGQVWSSIAEHWDDEGFENDYITNALVERSKLSSHPWSLAGGGAAELKDELEAKAVSRLGNIVSSVGFMAITGEDDVFARPRKAWERAGAEMDWVHDFGIGEGVRDWSFSAVQAVFFPYKDAELKEPHEYPKTAKLLWPYKRTLLNRPDFGGKKYIDVGRPWYSLHQVPLARLKVPLSIAFAFVATHNHFVLDRGGKVFKQTAPIIKLPEDATEEDHLALLAYLNSSTACFWMKQVFFDKGGGGIGGGLASAEWEKFFEFDGTKLKTLPVPAFVKEERSELARIAAEMLSIAEQISGHRRCEAIEDTLTASPTVDAVRAAIAEEASLQVTSQRRLVFLQEELDWWMYCKLGLAPEELALPIDQILDDEANSALRGSRPFALMYRESSSTRREIERYYEFTGQTEATECAQGGDPIAAARWMQRLASLKQKKSSVSIVERPEYKRNLRESWRPETAEKVLTRLLLGEIERCFENRDGCISIVEIRQLLSDSARGPVLLDCYCGITGVDHNGAIQQVVDAESVPALSCMAFSEAGLKKYAVWEDTWQAQRRADAGDGVVPSVPPKFSSKDYREARVFSLRGKLNVPKERFISLDGFESEEDGARVYGWAGWNHVQRAQALASLYQVRRNEDGWGAVKMTPMLLGLLELLPWVKQWHNEPSDEYGGLRLGDYFEGFLDGECAALGLTRDDLWAWRPPARKKGRRRARKGK